MDFVNTRVLLQKRPDGLPTPDTWTYTTQPVPDLKEGQMLLKQHYISLDPAMRGWIKAGRSYIEPVNPGDVMRAGSVAEVVATEGDTRFDKGQFLVGMGGVQTHVITNGDQWHPVDPSLAELPAFLGVLGMTGMTAYFGLERIGKIKEGDHVVVSAAAGAVGSVAVQMARIRGCRVTGIAGGEDKCRYIKEELGCHQAIDYKRDDLLEQFKNACTEEGRIDVYFDNVGGDILNTSLIFLNRNARVVICGAISQYNSEHIEGPSNYMSLLVNRATMQGMVVFDFAEEYPRAMKELAGWVRDNKINYRHDIHDGIENFHNTFLRLFSGEKLGKLILKVSDIN